MPSLGDLTVSFAADVSGLTAGIGEAKRQFVSIGDIAQSASNAVAGTTEGFHLFENALAGVHAVTTSQQEAYQTLVDSMNASLEPLSEVRTAAESLSSIPPFSLGTAISDEDAARAKLTLIESKVQEARKTLESLQGAANAGESVTGIPEAQAKLLLLEKDAQDARQAIEQVQHPPSTGGFLSSLGAMGSSVLNFANNATMMGQTIQQWGGALEQGLSHASDFQSAITSLETGAGEFHKNLGLVSSGILDMTGQVGESTQQLTSGMYLIESAGQHGSQALTTLRDAAEGAKVGNADLASVANGVTTAMTDYSASGLTASQATNDLIATVAQGKTHMADLASSFSSILPTAASVKVSFTDVSAAMATMTGEGTPAADAATYLRQTLMSLENPAAAGAAALKNIGLTTKQVSDGMKVSLPDTLKLITDHLKSKFPEGSAAYVKALADISGGSRQMQGVLELTGTHLKTFAGNVTTISGAVKKGGDSINGWATVQGDFNQKIDQAKGAVESLMIGIGSKLLPVVGGMIDKITPVVAAFTGWISKSNGLGSSLSSVGGFLSKNLLPPLEHLGAVLLPILKPIADWAIQNDVLGKSMSGIATVVGTIVTGLGTLINALATVVGFFEQNQVAADILVGVLAGLAAILLVMSANAILAAITSIPALLVGFGAWIIAAGAAAIATIAATWPLLLIGAVVAAVVVGIILAVQHWADIMKWLQGVAHVVTSAVGGFFSGLGSAIHDIIGGIGDAFSGLGSLVHSVWDGIVSSIKGAINAIIGGIDQFIGAINSIHITIPHIDAGPIHIGGGSIGFPQIPLIPKLSSGVENFQGGLAYVHKDEMLSYLPQGTNVARAGSGGGGDIQVHNHIYLDGREVTNQVMTRAMKEIRRNGGRAA